MLFKSKRVLLFIWQSFGSDTQAIITLNLPKPEGGGVDFATIVTSCLCLSLFFTYPIMMFPVFSILDGKMGVTKDNPKTILAVSSLCAYSISRW